MNEKLLNLTTHIQQSAYNHRTLRSGQEIEIDLRTTGCQGQSNEINFIEHIQVELDMEYTKRGDIAVNLTSAMGKQ